MGNEQSRSSLLNGPHFLSNIQLHTPMPVYDPNHYQVHQIYSHSPEHHRIVLEKIRVKKNYECPFLVKIIDSHTLQCQNICSTVIKTFIVLEKPKSLASQVETRRLHHTGFEEQELWSIIYSCTSAILFLIDNNVRVSKISASKIFIDKKNNVKVLDPEFAEGMFPAVQSSEAELMGSISTVIRNLMAIRNQEEYSHEIRCLLAKMDHAAISFIELRQKILDDYISRSEDKEDYTKSHMHSRIYGNPESYPSHRARQSNSAFKNSLNICGNRQSNTNLYASTRQKPSAATISQLGSSSKNNTAVNNSCLETSYVSAHCNKENKTHYDQMTTEQTNREHYPFQALENNANPDLSRINDNHYFPKKTLFSHKRKNERDQSIPASLSSHSIASGTETRACHHTTISLNSNLERIRNYKSTYIKTPKKKEDLKLEQRVLAPEKDNMITYHVDLEAEVCEPTKQCQGYIYMKMSDNTQNSDIGEDPTIFQEQELDEISMSEYKINVN